MLYHSKHQEFDSSFFSVTGWREEPLHRSLQRESWDQMVLAFWYSPDFNVLGFPASGPWLWILSPQLFLWCLIFADFAAHVKRAVFWRGTRELSSCMSRFPSIFFFNWCFGSLAMFLSEFIFGHVGAGALQAAFEVHGCEYTQCPAEDSRLWPAQRALSGSDPGKLFGQP